ncbi:hypothetical protein Rumeso_03018 [Rubellimicrobium mesophilum DSM 19309]|uniref:Uncharacterized protein n=1 Tax=Rubellimicrobium mesophilum DSM 19309 TaxID=442562 RepID=A0A017HMQ0_9RHOB|nr:hypothetical protein [Rubellimicrobium mesophilum]EYD75448.1 hypothetical protein Rumeso_03018 [Rubellimicrobium mesophilum DSM 19309]
MLSFLLLAGPAFGQAACPVSGDLPRGIRVDYDDGTTEVFRATGAPGVVAVLGTFGDGTGYRLELGQGLHLLSYTPVSADGGVDAEARVDYDYGRTAEELPVVEAEKRFDTPVRVTDQFGLHDQAQSQAYGAEEVLAIGTCSYRAVPVMIAYDTSNDYVEALRFLPELGIALLNWQESTDQARRVIEPVAIRPGK